MNVIQVNNKNGIVLGICRAENYYGIRLNVLFRHIKEVVYVPYFDCFALAGDKKLTFEGYGIYKNDIRKNNNSELLTTPSLREYYKMMIAINYYPKPCVVYYNKLNHLVDQREYNFVWQNNGLGLIEPIINEIREYDYKDFR